MGAHQNSYIDMVLSPFFLLLFSPFSFFPPRFISIAFWGISQHVTRSVCVCVWVGVCVFFVTCYEKDLQKKNLLVATHKIGTKETQEFGQKVFDIDFLKGLRLCVVFELPLLRNAPKNPRKESIGWGSKTKTRTCLSGVSHQVDSKNTKRKLFNKADVENVLQQNKKNSISFFFPSIIRFYCVFGSFSARGV